VPEQFVDVGKRKHTSNERNSMAKKSGGGRMTAAKTRAAKGPGGKGMVKNRPAGRKIMGT
jgi:hypothetical protein